MIAVLNLAVDDLVPIAALASVTQAGDGRLPRTS